MATATAAFKNANYKLLAENFMEYYHLPWVHPGLVKVSPMSAHHRWQGPGKYVGFCTSPIAANTDEKLAGGQVERIGGEAVLSLHVRGGESHHSVATLANHAARDLADLVERTGRHPGVDPQFVRANVLRPMPNGVPA